MKWILLLSVFIVTTRCDSELDEIIRQGNAKLATWPSNSDMIISLGLADTGTTTLIKFVSQPDDTLRVIRERGRLIFVDSTGEIGNETATLYPKLYHDYQNSLLLVDNPGFDETRGQTYEVASNYFTMKTIEIAKRVKLLFTIEASAIEGDISKNTDLLYFFKKSVLLFRDIKMVHNSIMLVVTKVENTHRYEEYITRTLASLINIKGFILTERQKMQPDHVDYMSYGVITQLIDLLVSTQNPRRIHVFMRPDKEGKITDSPMLLANKRMLRDFIYDNRITYAGGSESN